jgi:pyruvate formate-lyase/glycerol dehydratase family glycyl radical enzyme
MRPRIEKLKAQLDQKKSFVNWFLLEEIKMNSYLETEGLPIPIRRARMLEKMLMEMPISIEANDLLAGTEDDIFATSYNLFKSGLEEFDGYLGYASIYEEVKGAYPQERIEKVRDFWLNEEYEKTRDSIFTPEEQEWMDEAVFFVEPVTGHVIYDAPTVLAEGYSGILERVEKKLEAEEDEEKRLFYESLQVSLKAAMAFADRHSELAASMASRESDDERKQELLELSRILKKVPSGPAETFHEAVQSFWFTYVIMHIEQTPNPYAFSLGRVDQFLYPYYRQDKDSGQVTDGDAIELIQNLWIKINVGRKLWAVSQNAVIGGVLADGSDATNELTYLILKATEDLAIPLPTVTLKYHQGTPPELFDRAIQLLLKGRGQPTLINDDIVVESKVVTGVSLEDARQSVIAGCQEPLVQGAENARTTASWFSLPKCLELALNDGVSLLTGRQTGLRTGPLTDYLSYDDLYDAFWKQVDFFVERAVECANRTDRLMAELRPVPFLSAIMNDCIEKGRDFRKDGARYNFSGFLCHGVANVADSLAAIKKLVFEQERLEAKEVLEALRTNYESDPTIRLTLINHAPKYGNDDDYVDSIAEEVARRIADTVPRYKNSFGGAFRPGFSTPSTHVLYGMRCGATPDGRRHRDTFAFGIGPMQGYNRSGPTAVAKSVTKFPHWKATHGLAFSQSLPPGTITCPEDVEKVKAFIRTYLDIGGRYIHYNLQDVETLRDAKVHPEKHRDIIVRVHGMNAYFVNLDPLIQDDIISRAEHCV